MLLSIDNILSTAKMPLSVRAGPESTSTLSIEFVEPFTQQRGWIFAPLETGRFEGFTVPEAWALAIGAMACVLVAKRKRVSYPLAKGTNDVS
jgi:hypothetical protein